MRLVDVLFDWPAREVLALVEGLPDTSLYVAHLRGGVRWREFAGWGRTRHMLADIWDLEVAAALGAAGSKKKPPTYPRPGVKSVSQGTPLMAAFRAAKPKTT